MTLHAASRRALFDPDVSVGAEHLTEVCRRAADLYPRELAFNAQCHYYLGQLEGCLRRTDAALRAYESADRYYSTVISPQDLALRERSSAFAALLRGDAEAALAGASSARARLEPRKHIFYIVTPLAEIDLALRQALLRLGRAEEAVATLERALANYDRPGYTRIHNALRVQSVALRRSLAQALAASSGAEASSDRQAELLAQARREAAELGRVMEP